MVSARRCVTQRDGRADERDQFTGVSEGPTSRASRYPACAAPLQAARPDAAAALQARAERRPQTALAVVAHRPVGSAPAGGAQEGPSRRTARADVAGVPRPAVPDVDESPRVAGAADAAADALVVDARPPVHRHRARVALPRAERRWAHGRALPASRRGRRDRPCRPRAGVRADGEGRALAVCVAAVLACEVVARGRRARRAVLRDARRAVDVLRWTPAASPAAPTAAAAATAAPAAAAPAAARVGARVGASLARLAAAGECACHDEGKTGAGAPPNGAHSDASSEPHARLHGAPNPPRGARSACQDGSRPDTRFADHARASTTPR
jgi:hypothetical protein